MTQTSLQPSGAPARRVKSLQSPVLQQLERRLHARAFPEASLVVPGEFQEDSGHSYVFNVPSDWISDTDGISSLRLLEDGRHLGPAGSGHELIRKQGHGRFSHWSSSVLFSASDNSDPRTNGRVYTVVPPRDWTVPFGEDPWAGATLLQAPSSQENVSVAWRIDVCAPETIRPMGGCLFALMLKGDVPSDSDSFSTVLLLEDERPLGKPHMTSNEILKLRKDAYGHWGNDVLFAASDGTDPRHNGRSYTLAYARAFRFDHARLKPKAEVGRCWVLQGLPREWPCDQQGPSELRLLEDGKPLGPAHALHDQVRQDGLGAYCHWGTDLWFSTSDGSSPLTNGRTYTVVMQDPAGGC